MGAAPLLIWSDFITRWGKREEHSGGARNPLLTRGPCDMRPNGRKCATPPPASRADDWGSAMQRPELVRYSVADFQQWANRGELVLQPKFQRRQTWSYTARSYFIDTILRNLPVPIIYLRHQIELGKARTIREVVDGQQRLRAVLDYLDDQFTVSKVHNPDLGGLLFSELPEHIKESLLSYLFPVERLVGATDAEVLDMFARLNTYTVKLNRQELRNARYSGEFKVTVYALALDHLAFWINNRIFTHTRIARMAEAEFASELVVAMLAGLQDKKTSLTPFYKKYDERFRQAERVKQQFHSTMNTIGQIFSERLSKTPFRRRPLFYSLFCVVYDARYGLPEGSSHRYTFTAANREPIYNALVALGEELSRDPPSRGYPDFITATLRQTDNLRPRQIRHRYIWDAIRPHLVPAR